MSNGLLPIVVVILLGMCVIAFIAAIGISGERRRKTLRETGAVEIVTHGPVVIPGVDDTGAIPVVTQPCPEWCDPLRSPENAVAGACKCGTDCGEPWCQRRQAGAEAGLA